MSFHEYYEYEAPDERAEVYEGRWKWNAYALWDKADPNGQYRIEWSDLYGQEENVTFTVKIPINKDYVFYPLTRQFAILHSRWPPDLEVHTLHALELDWTNKTGIFGEESIQPPSPEYCENWTVLGDRAGQQDGGNINFLLYNYENTHQHCQLDVAGRRLTKLGDTFEIPCKNFYCLDLNGDVVSGLDTKLDQINRFCLKTRQLLPSLKVHGLPLNIYCIYPNEIQSHPASRQRAAGLWTSDRLYVWSEVGELNNSLSVIYFIQLETGVATAVDLVFDNQIRRLYLSPDGFLHVRNDKYIGYGKRDRHGNFVRTNHGEGINLLINYRFFRLPIRTPETLFFLSYAAVPKPVPPIVDKLMDKHKNLPKLVCK